MSISTLPLCAPPTAIKKPARLVLINPPALKGRTNERTLSGGIGVSRKLKPSEREPLAIPPIDFLYLAAVAETAGADVTLVDLLIDRLSGEAAHTFCLDMIGAASDVTTWVGVRVSMPSLVQDLEFANRLKALVPVARVFLFGAAIMATIDHWIRHTSVDYVLYGEAEAFFDRVLAAPDPLAVPGVISARTYEPLAGLDLYDEQQNLARPRCSGDLWRRGCSPATCSSRSGTAIARRFEPTH